jgi:hypothetical protein
MPPQCASAISRRRQPDPVVRVREIPDFVLTARAEPAAGFVKTVSPRLTKLPTLVVIELSAMLTASSDLQLPELVGRAVADHLQG